MTLDGMTQAKWDRLSPRERDAMRDNRGLTPQLAGLEGCRIEVLDNDGNVRRFKVGKSTGWRPCHLEVANARSLGGSPAARTYQRITVIRRP
jgi:hypothetical protein